MRLGEAPRPPRAGADSDVEVAFPATSTPRIPAATLPRTVEERGNTGKARSSVQERLEGPAGAVGEAHYSGIATEELRHGYARDGEADRARDDFDLTFWTVWWGSESLITF